MGQATMKLVRRQPRYVALLVAAIALAVLAFLLLDSSIGRATSSDSPYTLPSVVDTNPAANIVETTITSKEATVDVGNGVMAHAQTFNGTIPGPTFRLKIGDTVIVHYKNELAKPSGIHWHGIELSNTMDGTPFTQNQVPPGGEFLYKFTVSRPGIFWYHPHHHASTNQVFKGLYGLILVADPNEAALQASGTLPPAAQTKPVVLSDVTVCKAPGSNDTQTYLPGASPPALPWVNGPNLPAQQPPTPFNLCEGGAPPLGPINEDGTPRGPFAAGDIPNIQTAAHNGSTVEGQTVLTNGMNVGGRAGNPLSPGALAPGAATLDVQAGQGLRLPIVNASAVRFMRLHLSTGTGDFVPLVRVGGEGGLLDNAVVEGTVYPVAPGVLDFKYDQGEILLPPGARADVVAAIPPTATGVLTMWTEDFSRTGSGFSNIPTVPVMHLRVTGPAPSTYLISAGTPLRAATGDPVATIGPPTGTLLNPAAFVPVKPGLASQDVRLTQVPNTELGINGVFGTHDVVGDYTNAPHLGSTRWAQTGDTLELTVTNVTDAHHPFHLHGFSIQPISLTRPANPTYTWPYKEFRDNVDVPGRYTLTFRIKLEDRALPDGVTPGGAAGRWVFHCHIFFHATNGMLGELTVVAAANGNEKPDINADVTKVAATQGQAMSATGTFKDPDGDPVTLSASLGTVAAGAGGTWTWSRTATAADAAVKFVYITATDSGGRKDEAVFALDVSLLPVVAPSLTLAPPTATNPVLTNHTVTATLAGVSPLSGKTILFTTTGANPSSASATTSAAGTATRTWLGANAGSDTITACYDANANAVCDASEAKATASKRWVFNAPAVDHFKCYVVKPAKTRARSVTLTDQFGKRAARTGARDRLCNPVSKNGGKILHSKAHLTCYVTTDRTKTFKARRVRVVNQFGTRVLTVVKPKSLCLPSLKRLVRKGGTTRPPTGANPALSLDHFRCYAVTAGPATRTVKLRDQFGSTTTQVLKVVTLCNPVRKVKGRTVSRIRRPQGHLVCYTIREKVGLSPARRVVIRNQFEKARLRAVRIHSLCLPSLKQPL